MTSTTIGGAPLLTARYARLTAALASGVAASMVGGVVMALVMIVAFVGLQHASALGPLRAVGTLLYGERMLAAPAPAMYLAALALHFGICAAWGIVFALAATLLRVDASVGGALVLGIVIGLASLIVDVNLVAPALSRARSGQDLWTATMPPFDSWLGHIAFGLCFALAPRIRAARSKLRA